MTGCRSVLRAEEPSLLQRDSHNREVIWADGAGVRFVFLSAAAFWMAFDVEARSISAGRQRNDVHGCDIFHARQRRRRLQQLVVECEQMFVVTVSISR